MVSKSLIYLDFKVKKPHLRSFDKVYFGFEKLLVRIVNVTY
jgi:hypothetical protein